MTLARLGAALIGTVAAGSALLGTAATAGAWPTTVTPEMQRYITTARNAGAPGDDDALLTEGYQACNMLYTHQGRQAAIDAHGASVVNAATSILCTQAPG